VTCRFCGTEIADKALICFRCGRSTADEGRAAEGAAAVRRPLWPAAIALVVLVCAGLYMAIVPAGGIPDWLRWTITILAAVALVWRVALRRRRR